MRLGSLHGLMGLLVLALGAPLAASAQRSAGPRVEGRVEVIAARHSTVQAGAGFNAAAGNYVRWGLLAAAGVASRDDRAVATWRADAVVRFLLDPFRESPRGLYGLAGVSAMDDGSRDIEPAIVVGVGVEGRARGAVIPAVELALGGGTRLAVVLRRTRPGRR
jgi:hypothetical protein